MYNKYLRTEPNKNGTGVFTTADIPANTPICEFQGELFTTYTLIHDLSQVLQVGPNTYLGPSGGIDDYINHSCEPNCLVHIVGNRAILYSIYTIAAGRELTFDYSANSTDSLEDWKMECKCGSFNCRKIISGYQYLNDESKKEYKAKGMIPLFLLEPNMFQKR